MNSKNKSKWFGFLSLKPGSLSPNSEKTADFEVEQVVFGKDVEASLKKQNLMFMSKTVEPEKTTKRRPKMVTVSGSRFCQSLRHFFREVTVEPILFLYMLSTFSQYASFQDLVYSRACLQSYDPFTCDNLDAPEFKEEAEVIQSAASHLILLSTTSLVLPSIFIAVYLGSWSDRFGRKWPIIFPPFGGVLACVVLQVLAFKPHIPIQWVCLASFVSGLFGGFVSCIMSCMSYVSAISSEENRTVRISRLEAMIFLGGTVGPFLSGSLLQHIGHGMSFVFMMVCYLIAFLYALFCVKEVKSEHNVAGKIENVDHDDLPNLRPQSAASSGSVVSSSLKSSTLDNADLDLESAEHLLSHKHNLDMNLPDVTKSLTEAVFVDTHHVEYHHDSYQSPSPYQPLSSNSGHSHFEDASSTAASEDEQRNILRRSRDSPETEQDVSCCSRYFGSEHFFAALKTVAKKREGGRRLNLILTLAAGYIIMIITAGELDVAYLFAKGEPLKWTHKTFSYYFGFKYGLGTLVLLVGMPIFQHFQIRDTTMCVLGLFSRMAGLVLYALSPDTTVAFFVPIVAILSTLSLSATRSILSKLVSSDEQGKIFAFVAIMEDLCTMTASMMFNGLYPLTRPILKGFIFLLAAVLLIVPVFIMWFIGRRLTKMERLELRQQSTAEERKGQHSQEDCDHL